MPDPAAGGIWPYSGPTIARSAEATMRILFNDEPMQCDEG
jgi:hypothetical protein